MLYLFFSLNDPLWRFKPCTLSLCHSVLWDWAPSSDCSTFKQQTQGSTLFIFSVCSKLSSCSIWIWNYQCSISSIIYGLSKWTFFQELNDSHLDFTCCIDCMQKTLNWLFVIWTVLLESMFIVSSKIDVYFY